MAALTASHAAAVHAASDTLLPAGCQAAPLRLRGADALVFHSLDRTEHARRTAAQAGPLDSFGPLELLATLPIDLPVPRRLLDPAVNERLRRLPRGAVARTRQEVTRLAVRPLRVDLIVVRAPGPRSGMELASQFAPFSRRAMLLRRTPRRFEELLIEADFYGIGVFVGDDAGAQMALAPEPHRPLRHTTAGWRFTEQLYREITQDAGCGVPSLSDT